MKPPAFEQYIGIETYFTSGIGCGGKIRTNPEDFIVRERFLYPKKVEHGSYTIAEVSCCNWETHMLVRELGKRLRISRDRISFAGTKDKRACSSRLMSFAQVAPEELSKINITDVRIENIFQSDIPVEIGDLYGNTFSITIRNIDPTFTHHKLEKNIQVISKTGGFPNFYGVQRFGSIRPVHHMIGKYIVLGDFEQAAMTYIAHPFNGEDAETYKLRDELEQTKDFSKALKTYPDKLNFEKAILNRLVVDPSDYIGALQQLPKNLLMMFVNAYQSYLFNKMLSERIRRKLSIHQALLGDIVLPMRNKSIHDEYIVVSKSNNDKVNKQLEKKKAFVSSILVGSKPVFAQGEMGEIEHHVFDSEHIDHRDFIIPEIPFLSSSGTRRALFAPIDTLKYTFSEDTYNPGKQGVNLEFDLLKGCYATSFLREIMKSKESIDY
jgi:tRNA pseudouridine13 synthase